MNTVQTAEPTGKPESVRHASPATHHRGIRRLLKGYRAGIVHCALAAASVFIVNVGLTLSARSRYGSKDGVGTLMEGSCDAVKPLNTILHLVINVLSTFVLAGSNYCMQCLTAPSREEVDKAHAVGDWVEIGLPSIRNLRRVSRWKVVTWVCLALSSLPLHLFYNSAIFTTIGVSDYSVFLANQTYVDDILNKPGAFSFPPHVEYKIPKLESTGDADADSARPPPTCPANKDHMQNLRLNKKFKRLENKECITAYIRRFQSQHRDVFLVTKEQNVTELCSNPVSPASSIRGKQQKDSDGRPIDQLRWLCDLKSDNKVCLASTPASIADNAPTWQPMDVPVSYCMSEEYSPTCKLQFSTLLLQVVIVFNALKVFFMLLTLKVLNNKPLLTLGDAVASFLETEDPFTKGRCLLERKDCDKDKHTPKFPRAHRGKRRFWLNAASSMRWITYFILMGFLLFEYYTFLIVIFGQDFGRNSLGFLWGLGWTPTDSATLADDNLFKSKSPVTSAVIANLAQPLLSINYMAQNGLLTAMLQGKEWDDFATQRRGLKVSWAPAGRQTTSRYLQLPTRFALPLMALSGVLHYLFSQGIFAVHIQGYDEMGKPYGDVIASVGFSLVAIVAANAGLIVTIIIVVSFGFQRYRSYIPHVGSCSLVISAACHPDRRGVDGGSIQYDDLQWGVTGTRDEVGHCSFSSGPVELPTVGTEYAGL